MIYHIYSVQKKHNEKGAFFQWFDNYLNQLLGFHYTSGQLLTFKSAGEVRDWDRERGRRMSLLFQIHFLYILVCANVVKWITFPVHQSIANLEAALWMLHTIQLSLNLQLSHVRRSFLQILMECFSVLGWVILFKRILAKYLPCVCFCGRGTLKMRKPYQGTRLTQGVLPNEKDNSSNKQTKPPMVFLNQKRGWFLGD